ncbi:unnamed protein product [Gadus morhua 'NCC']
MFQLIPIFIMAGLMTVSTQGISEQSRPSVNTINISEGRLQDVNTRCWTEWFDRDHPSGTGDWEILTSLRNENPGKICPTPVGIEVETTTGLSIAAAGEVIAVADATTGFICKNEDQPDQTCLDYRVRFVCHPPFCNQHICWSKWLDRDNPGGTGDWETLSQLRIQYPGSICDEPLYIEAVTVDTMTPALATGQNFFIFNPTTGFVCRNSDQTKRGCLDYKVRFGCCCDPETPIRPGPIQGEPFDKAIQ